MALTARQEKAIRDMAAYNAGMSVQDVRNANRAGTLPTGDTEPIDPGLAIDTTAATAPVQDNALAIPPMPTLEVPTLEAPSQFVASEFVAPEFEMPAEANVQYQLDKLLGKDSKLMQRAKTTGTNLASAMGQSRGSLAAGHAMNAMIDKGTPISGADARLAGEAAQTAWEGKYNEALTAFGANLDKARTNWQAGEDTKYKNWSTQFQANMAEYNTKATAHMQAMGFDQDRINAVIGANTNLTTTLMGVANNLLSNTDINNSESSLDWIIESVMQPAQESINAAVGNIYIQ